MKVYPVQLTPLDWFAGLSTSFTLEDLTQDPEVIRMQINAKSHEIDILTAQLVALEMSGKGDPTDLHNKVQAAQTALDTAQGTLSMANSVIAMANTCLDAFGKLDTGALAKKLQVVKDVLGDRPAMMEMVQEEQNNLTASSRALSQLLTAQALAEASDTKQHAVDHGEQDVPTAPIQLPEDSTSGGSRWQTTIFTSDSTSWDTNTKNFSAANNDPAIFVSTNAAAEDTIDLAFRATLVTVDRGGWFQPQFFKESKVFYKANPGITWTKATPQTIGDIVKGDARATGLMPGFPIAFLLAKDLTDATSAASSGGFLCFSFQSYNNGYIIKIPGPQILGYMIQVLDPDQTRPMPKELPAGFFVPDAEYDNTVSGPSHGADPGGPIQPQ
ncbi:hypothetical protein DFH08DRAFT_979057 [Mycena albidolilacea]|uniref:Uncharacterized protein n=1 Tax=Mycena albidolilacea TaxID=1033008 RepID=A0AAD6YXH6_9AGAR|nr:hypothetical protein DFH08DRAFT_979057 [Mycena albidolilacea]